MALTAENETPLALINKQLLFHLSGKSAVQKMAAAMVIMEWATIQRVRIYIIFLYSKFS